MLGARARAAEYHAAKAATARQQASKDADELEQKILKPCPVALSAFTRNTSTNRNKGSKTFVPLDFSQEEEGSTSDREIETLTTNSPSNRPVSAHPPRAASLPPQAPPHTQGELARNVQTPHRYREYPGPPIVPFAPRAMFSDDGHGFPPHYALQAAPQPLHGYAHMLMPPQVYSAPPIGWYMPPEQYDLHRSLCDTGFPPTTPVPEKTRPQNSRPDMNQRRSDETNKETETSRANSKIIVEEPITTTDLGGRALHIFGPDDLSPTKFEIKQRIREQTLEEHSDARSMPIQAAPLPHINTPGSKELLEKHELIRSLQSQSQPLTPTQQKLSNRIKNLLIDRSVIAPVRPRTESMARDVIPSLETLANRSVPDRRASSEADWPYLGQPSNSHDEDAGSQETTARISREMKAGERTRGIPKLLLEALRARAETGSSANLRPPPGLSQPREQEALFKKLEGEQITKIKFPLVDINSSEWLDVRMPSSQERDRMRRVYAAVREGAMSDADNEGWEDRRGVPRPELARWLENSSKQYASRMKRVNDLAKEMQQKWEYGGSFRSATMSKDDARKNAATVKAVGSMMSTLSMQTEDLSGMHHRGSRPYCQPPEYAIERSVGLDKGGKSHSLFESDGGADRAAPPRLARDPRFRPQLGEAALIEDGKIPRMFPTRRL